MQEEKTLSRRQFLTTFRTPMTMGQRLLRPTGLNRSRGKGLRYDSGGE